jgi:hypothetical protein
MVGKVRQTTKEKRKDQLNARKVIVRCVNVLIMGKFGDKNPLLEIGNDLS